MNTKSIKIIGLGGIGGWLVEPLCLHLSHSKDNYDLTLIDGDKFELKNLSRQRFSSFENKAAVVAEKLKTSYSANNIQFNSKGIYLNQDNVVRHIREGDVVMLCVDNHATRKVVSDRCEELNNVTLISGGNDLTDGNVIYYSRKDGVETGKPPTKLFKEIANPVDHVPGTTTGCDVLVESEPQLVFANNTAATLMLNTFYMHEENKVDFDQVYFDIKTLGVRKTPEKEIQTLQFDEE